MNEIEMANQNEIDRDILTFTREMQKMAPVTDESVESFLRIQRRRRITPRAVADRLHYLTAAGFLSKLRAWRAGEFVSYEITATGMDFLDGTIPPRNWSNEQ